MAVANKLKTFRTKANGSVKWKIIANDAIVTSKLLYGLETANITNSQMKKLDTFQLKGLRRILKMTTTCINRENTDETVYKTAEENQEKKITKLSERYMLKRARLLGHIIRASEDDPLKQIPMTDKRPWLPSERRIGLPRQDWFEQTYNYVWREILKKAEPTIKWKKDSNLPAIEIINTVNNSAINRGF